MTSSSYMLERELLGSARAIIDANSNVPLTQQSQYSTFRGPYTTTSTNFSPLGYGTTPCDNSESRKALADVSRNRTLYRIYLFECLHHSYKTNYVF